MQQLRAAGSDATAINDTMAYFHDLGQRVEVHWRSCQFREDSFPDIAANALAESPACSHVDVCALLRHVSAPESTLPVQADPGSLFGEPPLTVYRSMHFFIDVYFWFDGTTALHDHSFFGAFQVITGGSIHSRFSFDPTDRVNARLAFGELKRSSLEWLTPGEIRPISAGPALIHSLFHLECPSATVVIRSPIDLEHLPQRTYLPPFVSYVSPADIVVRRRIESLDALRRINSQQYRATLLELACRADLETAVHVFARHLSAVSTFPELGEELKRQHGERGQRLIAVYEEMIRQECVRQRRAHTEGTKHRAMLGILLNVNGRRAVFDIVGRRFRTKDPAAEVMACLRQLAAIPSRVSPLEPNALGIPFAEDELVILEYLLRGHGDEEVFALLADSYDPQDLEQSRAAITQLITSLRSAPILQSIVADRD